jgi:hypothetical protein
MVKLEGSDKASVKLIYYILGIGAGVYLAMRMCNYYPRQTLVPLLFGSILEAVAVGILPWALHKEKTPTISGLLVLAGAGAGLRSMPGTVLRVKTFESAKTNVDESRDATWYWLLSERHSGCCSYYGFGNPFWRDCGYDDNVLGF